MEQLAKEAMLPSAWRAGGEGKENLFHLLLNPQNIFFLPKAGTRKLSH